MQHRRHFSGIPLTALLLMAMWVGTPTQGQEAELAGKCLPRTGARNVSLPRLDCFELYPTDEFPGATGAVTLRRVPGPFSISVTVDGTIRYNLIFDIEGLPPAENFGPTAVYIAWVTTPSFAPTVKLGAIENGRTLLGEAAFNKFNLLVTLEKDKDVSERSRSLVLRGRSPSNLMEAHDLLAQAPSAFAEESAGPRESDQHHHDAEWTMPPMHAAVPMLSGMARLVPKGTPFLPSAAPSEVPEARPRQLIRLGNGGTLDLEAAPVRRTINGRSLIMYGFNGQVPGPLIRVQEQTTIFVNFTNHTEWPTAIHWHGVRLDNRYDGVPGVTQDPVEPGESFRYEIFFRDAGIYWYHPHHREDIQQELGLMGNMLVDPTPAEALPLVNREEVLILDDLLLEESGIVAFGETSANYALMGRFGNVFLINGEPGYALAVDRDEVVRFFLTNAANTRTFNLSFGNAPTKVVGSDIGKFETEVWVDSIVLAPAERYIVDVHFTTSGTVEVVNWVQGINHRYGGFLEERTLVGRIEVGTRRTAEDFTANFAELHQHEEVVADIDRYRGQFDRPVDYELTLTLETTGLARPIEEVMRFDGIYFNPVEWTGTMPMMNWLTTTEEIRWILRESDTGHENDEIDWRFRLGDLVKIRLHNDRFAFHAMQHPLHIHGQRFLVVDQDGLPNTNLVWKDTVLLPVGSVTDILLEISNPGRWMVHCHIAEHLESGMKFVFEVGE